MKKQLIAFMGGMLDQEKNSNFIRELEIQCVKSGYLPVAFSFSETTAWNQDNDNCELKLIDLAENLDFKAVIMQLEFLKNNYIVSAIMSMAERKHIPVIAMERKVHGLSTVSMNFKDGFSQMVRHIIEKHGCKKINMIAGPEKDLFSMERVDAYKGVLAAYNIPFEEKRLGYGDFWDRPARAVTRDFISSGDIPEAIVCANDAMALACVDELNRLGFRVPEDIIVTGFDGIKSTLFHVPSISTVEPDYESEAAQIVQLIKEYTKGSKPRDCSVNFVLKLRRSCGCNRTENMLSPMDAMNLSTSFIDVNWAVDSINNMMSAAAISESLKELSNVLSETLWIWERQFQFVGILSDLIRPEKPEADHKDYITLFRCENETRSGIGPTYNEEDFLPNFNRVVENPDIGLLIVRLLHTGNQIFGYVVEGSRNSTPRDIRRCEEIGMFLSTAINSVITNRELAEMQREMERISVHDHLTGIFNRRGFYNELDKIIKRKENKGRYLTFFSVDMDNLKHINDFYGHSQGDFAIQCLAEALHHFASRNGFCARYGGDEFACALLTDMPISLSADTVRSRLDNVLKGREDVLEKEYTITASIGSVDSAMITDNFDYTSLLKAADEVMYQDKQARKVSRG